MLEKFASSKLSFCSIARTLLVTFRKPVKGTPQFRISRILHLLGDRAPDVPGFGIVCDIGRHADPPDNFLKLGGCRAGSNVSQDVQHYHEKAVGFQNSATGPDLGF